MTWLLSVPALLLVGMVFGWPLLRYGWLSLHASSVVTGFIPVPNSGANWMRLLQDPRFWQDAGQTLRFMVVSVGLEVLLALAIALLLDQHWRGRGMVRAITLLPWALPTATMSLGWRWIFNSPYGPLEQWAQALGLSPLNLLSDPNTTWLVTVFADVWKTTPFITLLLLAGLQTIPSDLYSAFRLEGGRPGQALLAITLPLLTPYIPDQPPVPHSPGRQCLRSGSGFDRRRTGWKYRKHCPVRLPECDALSRFRLQRHRDVGWISSPDPGHCHHSGIA